MRRVDVLIPCFDFENSIHSRRILVDFHSSLTTHLKCRYIDLCIHFYISRRQPTRRRTNRRFGDVSSMDGKHPGIHGKRSIRGLSARTIFDCLWAVASITLNSLLHLLQVAFTLKPYLKYQRLDLPVAFFVDDARQRAILYGHRSGEPRKIRR